jgi:hypothetical protein
MRSAQAVTLGRSILLSAVYLGLGVFVACRTTRTAADDRSSSLSWRDLSARRLALAIAFHAALTGLLFGAAMV